MTFRCSKLACQISAEACALRHIRANTKPRKNGSWRGERDHQAAGSLGSSPCAKCEIGHENAAKGR